MIDRAIMITVTAVYPRPKRKPRGITGEVWQSGIGSSPRRPDLDNVIKLGPRRCTASRVLKDDGLAVELHAVKVWRPSGRLRKSSSAFQRSSNVNLQLDPSSRSR